MEWNVAPGRGYRYYTEQPVFKFGFGTALTTFSVRNATAAPLAFSTATPGARAEVRINVTNTGDVTGDEVVQLYAYPPASATQPRAGELPLLKQLIGYARVHLAPGESAVVAFNVTAADLAVVDRVTAARTLRPASMRLEADTGAPGAEPVRIPVDIAGEERELEAFPLY